MLRLLQLAQELDWQVMDLKHAGEHPGKDAKGELVETRQKSVLATADKIQRELLASVRFDPLRLVGVGGSISDTLDSLGELLLALDKIRLEATGRVDSLPSTVRSFQGLLKGYCNDGAPMAA
ncbi:MAG TPA: hypothetical protein VGZ29_16735 [Terriglobia bacterium]|nr:hypothetical protein [Terriglobia bacterium]